MELTLNAGDGTGDPAMFVAWIETTEGRLVRTLMMFSKHQKYYRDLTLWWKPHYKTEGAPLPDAMVSPTIKWGMSRTVTVPLDIGGGHNLLSGDFALRIEQRTEHGAHNKNIRIHLVKDFTEQTIENEGHLKSFTVRVKKEN